MKSRYFYFLLMVSLLLPLQAEDRAGAPVRVTVAGKQSIYQRIPMTGTVTSSQVARISVAVEGLVLDINVDEGDRVTRGDLLLTLDSELAELRAKSAAAKTRELQNLLRDAQRRLREARALSKNIAESTIRDLQSEVSADQALLQQALAEQGYVKALLKRHQIYAPFDGLISTKLTELGEWVRPGQGVFQLVAFEKLRIDFKVSEDYLARIGPEATIFYTFNAYPQKGYHAPVGTLVPVSDPNARTFLLRVPIEQPEHKVIPGMSVSAQMKIPTGRQGVVVPRDAILRMPDGRTLVWSLEQSDDEWTVAENSVITGISFDGQVEILDGLPENTTVVVKGNEALLQGQRVFILDEPGE